MSSDSSSLLSWSYTRARTALLRRLEAKTRLIELEVAEKEFRLTRERINYSLILAKKLPPGIARETLYAQVAEHAGSVYDGRTQRVQIESDVPRQHKLDRFSN